MQGVEVDTEGEREEALRDPLGEAARCLGEVPLEPHLLFQVRARRDTRPLTEVDES